MKSLSRRRLKKARKLRNKENKKKNVKKDKELNYLSINKLEET